MIRVRVVQRVQVPAPVDRESGHAVGACGEQLPQFFRRADAPGEPAAHSDDHDGIVGVRRRHGSEGVGPLELAAEQLGTQMLRQDRRRRMVEHHGGRERQPRLLGQTVAELDGGQRVEAQLAEGAHRRDRLGARVRQHDRGLLAYEFQECPGPLPSGGRRQPVPQG